MSSTVVIPSWLEGVIPNESPFEAMIEMLVVPKQAQPLLDIVYAPSNKLAEVLDKPTD